MSWSSLVLNFVFDLLIGNKNVNNIRDTKLTDMLWSSSKTELRDHISFHLEKTKVRECRPQAWNFWECFLQSADCSNHGPFCPNLLNWWRLPTPPSPRCVQLVRPWWNRIFSDTGLFSRHDPVGVILCVTRLDRERGPLFPPLKFFSKGGGGGGGGKLAENLRMAWTGRFLVLVKF